MPLAWMGRRAARYLIVIGLVAACAYAIGKPQLPRIGFATAVAGVPVNRTAPTITGDQRLGGVLTCGRGTWDDPEGAPYAVEHQWVRDNQDLTGETSTTHTVVPADIGHGVRCDVRATGDYGTSEANSPTFYPPAPDALTPPRVSGDLRLGRTLTCTRGVWNDDGVPAYPTATAWLRNGAVIAGQTGTTYTVTTDDVGRQMQCRVSVLALASSTATGVYATAPIVKAIPQISGDPRLGGTLNCGRGTWDDEGLTPYATTKQWLRGNSEILGATGDDYTVRLADIGTYLSCRVRAADLTDSTSSAVYPTSPAQRSQPGIEGDPRLGRSLTCKRGTWDDAGRTGEYGVSYEWYRNNVFISEGASYPVADIDVNKSLRCQVTVEGISQSNTPTISGTPPDNLTVPTLSGDARLGRSLSCSRGMWDDPATPYVVTYQWLRNGAVIDGATNATYAITAADVNRGLSCRVTAASFTQATSSSVSVQPPEDFLPPRIEGDPRVGNQLTCTRGDWDDPAIPYAVTYQWYRGGTAIADATNATYTVTAAETGTYVQCRVRGRGLHHRQLAAGLHDDPGRRRHAGEPDRARDLRRPAPAPHAHLQPRQLERPGHAVPRELPLAARQRGDPRRDDEQLHDHERRHRPVAQLPGHGQRADHGHDPVDDADQPRTDPRPGRQRRPAPAPDALLQPRHAGTTTPPIATRSRIAGCATAPRSPAPRRTRTRSRRPTSAPASTARRAPRT